MYNTVIMFHVVLHEPEIPQNAGNIARTCAATGCVLHLIRPLGFELSDRYLKRAGLDYWHLVEVHVHDDIEEVIGGVRKKITLFYDKSPLRPFQSALCRGGLSHLREGDERTSRRTARKTPRRLRADPHAGGEPIAQSEQFRSDRRIRRTAAE